MSHRTTLELALTAALAVALVALPACEQKKSESPPVEHAAADGGAAAQHGVDKSLAEAVAAVAGNPGADQKGPPESGVFAPGAADREMRAGDYPKLVLGNKGTGDTIQFAGLPKPMKKLEGRVEVAIQTGPRSAMPTIDLGVTFEPESVKGEPGAAVPVPVNGKVASAKLAAEQPGELPAGLDKQVAKAKGSRIGFEFAPAGGARVTDVVPTKDMDESFVQVVRSASNAFSVAFLPYPTEPVGVGAFWMVTSRESFAGLDVVVYRMMKLEKIDAGHATISVSAKRFVAGGDIGFQGLPPHDIAEFAGNTNGRIVVSAADPADVQGELVDALVSGLSPKGAPPAGVQPGQKLQVHVEMQTRFQGGK